jgi:hypothetical protein
MRSIEVAEATIPGSNARLYMYLVDSETDYRNGACRAPDSTREWSERCRIFSQRLRYGRSWHQ